MIDHFLRQLYKHNCLKSSVQSLKLIDENEHTKISLFTGKLMLFFWLVEEVKTTCLWFLKDIKLLT